MFTTGNIITLGICLILIVIFRHFDKSNRSFEKLKRFYDKQKDDFSAYVTTKTQGLENASIDIRTMMDRASAAIAKLKETRSNLEKEEEELYARRKEVTDFILQIKASGQTVSKLMEAIAAADKNLAKIAEESDFADSIGVKIQNAKKEMEGISMSLSQLEQRFARENSAALSAAREEVFSKFTGDVEEINSRVEKIRRESEKLEATALENLQRVYDNLFEKASDRAEKLEENVFEKLQGQALARLEKYKETIETRTSEMLQQTKEKLSESQQSLKDFKAEWKNQSETIIRESKTHTHNLVAEQTAVQKSFFEKLKNETAGLSEKISASAAASESRLAALEEKLTGFEKDSSYQLSKFNTILDEIPSMDGKLRMSLQDLEKKTSASFELFVQDQNTRRDSFEASFNSRSESLMNKIQNLENSINDLKTHAYANVSEKLKAFEDDFFRDLTNRGNAMAAEIQNWQDNLEGRLEALSAKNESERTDAENEYTEKLKERLSELAESYRAQTDKIENQISEVELDLRNRITNSAASIQTFSEQYRTEFLQAKENADVFARNELQTHSIELQEALRKQRLEMDSRYRDLLASIETAREDSENMINGIKENVSEWQRKNERLMETASSELEGQISEFRDSTAAMIKNLEVSTQEDFSAAVKRIGQDTLELQNSVEDLRGKITNAGKDLDERSREALDKFAKTFETLSKETAEQIEETKKEADNSLRLFKTSAVEIGASFEDTKQKLFKKLQNDVDSISDNLDEITAKQKNFVEQTRIFTRADELKTNLEESIEKLKIEVGSFNVYQETMSRLENQYKHIRSLEEEAEQKLGKMSSEKKRIDAMEADFNNLLGLSSKIAERISELTRTNDDVQEYQVKIRRFEDSINDVNTRYERLAKKALVLDQTIDGVDKAFNSLKELENNLRSYREETAALPEDIAAIKNKIDTLLDASERAGEVESKVTQLESELSDVEKRSKRIQADRESFVNTEKRLVDLKKEADKAIGLFHALVKEEDPTQKKKKGAPAISDRENIKALKHEGWTTDQIARALHLSKGEVELVLEMPD